MSDRELERAEMLRALSAIRALGEKE